MKLVGKVGIPAGAGLGMDELNKDVRFERGGITPPLSSAVPRP